VSLVRSVERARACSGREVLVPTVVETLILVITPAISSLGVTRERVKRVALIMKDVALGISYLGDGRVSRAQSAVAVRESNVSVRVGADVRDCLRASRVIIIIITTVIGELDGDLGDRRGLGIRV